MEVVQAGTPEDRDDKDDKPEAPYTESPDGNYTVNTPDGLQQLFTEHPGSDFSGETIVLKAGEPYSVTGQLASTFKGTLKSAANENEKASIVLSGS